MNRSGRINVIIHRIDSVYITQIYAGLGFHFPVEKVVGSAESYIFLILVSFASTGGLQRVTMHCVPCLQVWLGEQNKRCNSKVLLATLNSEIENYALSWMNIQQ